MSEEGYSPLEIPEKLNLGSIALEFSNFFFFFSLIFG
jgi:hypothetical protein